MSREDTFSFKGRKTQGSVDEPETILTERDVGSSRSTSLRDLTTEQGPMVRKYVDGRSGREDSRRRGKVGRRNSGTRLTRIFCSKCGRTTGGVG